MTLCYPQGLAFTHQVSPPISSLDNSLGDVSRGLVDRARGVRALYTGVESSPRGVVALAVSVGVGVRDPTSVNERAEWFVRVLPLELVHEKAPVRVRRKCEVPSRPEEFMPSHAVDLAVLPFSRHHPVVKFEHLRCAVDLPVQLPAHHRKGETTIVLPRIVIRDYGDRVAPKADLCEKELESFGWEASREFLVFLLVLSQRWDEYWEGFVHSHEDFIQNRRREVEINAAYTITRPERVVDCRGVHEVTPSSTSMRELAPPKSDIPSILLIQSIAVEYAEENIIVEPIDKLSNLLDYRPTVLLQWIASNYDSIGNGTQSLGELPALHGAIKCPASKNF
ncbi:hypothetical protein EDB87DRAFT_1580228 [Lactarius vividus]|nr:hypothetical protein EDB87DRAFT_1580228 [Lactarius vividus]